MDNRSFSYPGNVEQPHPPYNGSFSYQDNNNQLHPYNTASPYQYNNFNTNSFNNNPYQDPNAYLHPYSNTNNFSNNTNYFPSQAPPPPPNAQLRPYNNYNNGPDRRHSEGALAYHPTQTHLPAQPQFHAHRNSDGELTLNQRRPSHHMSHRNSDSAIDDLMLLPKTIFQEAHELWDAALVGLGSLFHDGKEGRHHRSHSHSHSHSHRGQHQQRQSHQQEEEEEEEYRLHRHIEDGGRVEREGMERRRSMG